MKFLSLLSFILAAQVWAAETAPVDVNQDFDSLGDNRIILEKAKALNPEKQVSVVQTRLVPRRNRFEITTEYGGTFGGDTYTKTQNLGLNVQYHFNPNFSMGARYNHFFNQLTAEGKALFERAYAEYLANPGNPSAKVPEVDYPKSEAMVLLNWYPIYGKMNVFDKTITHFDFYTLLGTGTVQLQSGSSSTYTVGGGFGFWHTPKLSSRIEMRYQNYEAEYYTGKKSLDLAIASFQIGWLL